MQKSSQPTLFDQVGQENFSQEKTNLHEIDVNTSIDAVHAYLIAPSPGGRSKCFYLNGALKKWDICFLKVLAEAS